MFHQNKYILSFILQYKYAFKFCKNIRTVFIKQPVLVAVYVFNF